VASNSFARPGRGPATVLPIARDRKTPARFAKAVAFHQAGRLDQAVTLYRRIIEREPDLPEVHGNLGTALVALGRLSEAAASCQRAIALDPDKPKVWCQWGAALAGLGRLAEAEEKLRRAILLDRDFAAAHCQLGNTLRQSGRLDAAEDMLRRAVALDPNRAEAHAGLGDVLLDRGQPLKAAAAFGRAVALKPDFAGAYNNLSLALKEAGRLVEAGHAAEAAIRLAPKRAAYYANLAEVRTFTHDDPHVAALEALTQEASTQEASTQEALAQDASLVAGERAHLHFALAKAYEDVGRPDDAFAQLLAGNALKRRAIVYDEAATLARMERTRELFTPELIAARRGCGDATRLPVLILGMPRSGTTLVEQILASHPRVYGAGEVKLFDQAVAAMRDLAPGAAAGGATYPDMIADMQPEHFHMLGAIYAERLAQLEPGALHIIDKMPQNFIYAGLIHLALPYAPIIHVVRDPIDTCVSCFAKLFVEGQAYSYDLAELGRYYARYRDLMAHWRRVLPPARMLEVRYEDVVADLEGAARRIVAHCGLAWDARCLDFHRTERTVRTASAAQVRRPIYADSVARRRKYERFLAPLAAELDAGTAAARGHATL
jgi:Flp pilus assembly protein TadD